MSALADNLGELVNPHAVRHALANCGRRISDRRYRVLLRPLLRSLVASSSEPSCNGLQRLAVQRIELGAARGRPDSPLQLKQPAKALRDLEQLAMAFKLFESFSCALMVNPSSDRSRPAASGFSKPTWPRAERAGGHPLGRLTAGFLHLKALEPPYNPPLEAPLKIRLRRSRRL